MHRFHLNFKKTVRDRAAEYSAKAYNHYRRLSPMLGRIYQPIKNIHNRYLGRFKNNSH